MKVDSRVMRRSLGLYNVYVGGSPAGARLARLHAAGVRAADLPDLLERWRAERAHGEPFGDWAARAGLGQGWHAA